MRRLITWLWISFVVGVPILGTNVYAVESCDPETQIELNLAIPFVGKCIDKSTEVSGESTTYTSVFPRLIGGTARIVMTMIIILGFLGILLGGFMITADGAFGTKAKGVKLITTIIAGLILLGASGIILNLINPTFFGTASGGT